ncbi:uncharacterized protein CcaverHIS019_0110830 [Cutaneotrichosporon cavernicola]|uniref:non-specific serine/threonine protein kinase n=1 Tax=Cutaneotrichosporon cavernicola TaxID=279322 RepID=A0AA48I783_9TREE|nr:uncharacterized protein CcaverHIS019_0110830 [Cutaneotrichosporon cavernicola]BEI88365.1 hypothetical protein CcaverHIS019_0110830 [Cutaneotrichosporon cavernicola]BEI96138.1 hypothetical protein CcaverHIS631_0110870 [Cutaneotrichosporon cavernicola]
MYKMRPGLSSPARWNSIYLSIPLITTRMVSVPYRIPLPASPPPSPPRCMGQMAAGTTSDAFSSSPSSSIAAAVALKNAIAGPSRAPNTDGADGADGADTKSNSDSSSALAGTASMPKLNDFQLIRVLGKGCAGRVLLVKHTSTSRVHAMKAISKRAVLANDELDHTLTEQEILRHFSCPERKNAFVSRLYYSFCDKENFYLVMEFYPGGDLATQMEIHGILGPLRTRFYTCDIVAGLEALHRQGILVRDLKPENILLNWHGHAVLADFGLSKSFGYRGDPIPVKLPPDYIEGKGTPPIYAGKGFGSYRNGELTWDRAFSFVGTQEYLAPEVIKRNHYTYAIDWWALGCIVCECLTGRVPFRGHEDESNAQLYDRVVNARWDAIYRGDTHPITFLKDRYRIDSITYDFIDGLLQKEPMFRLTEPSVKSHPYFTNVDWATVAKGDYQDPFQLEIDPVAEYNTQFFPRLCLEETPTVDMSGHDYGKDTEHEKNALNNDDIYMTLQTQFARELESFEWSCQGMYDTDEPLDEGSQTDEQHTDEIEADQPVQDEVQEESGQPALHERMIVSPSADDVSEMRDISMPDISHDGSRQEASQELEHLQTPSGSHTSDLHLEQEPNEEGKDADMGATPPLNTTADVVNPKATAAPSAQPSERDEPPSPVPSKAAMEAKAPSIRSQASSIATTAPSIPSIPTQSATNATRPSSIATKRSSVATRPASVVSKPPSIIAAMSPSTNRKALSVGTKAPSVDTKLASSPISPKAPSIRLPDPSDPPTSPTHSMGNHIVPTVEVDDVEEIRGDISMPREPLADGQMPRLPSGPPLSGLSVSDVISIAPNHQGSPNLIIRRHRHLPSIDSYPHARLSVDINGTFGQLGDEDWEQLDADAIPELPNGANESGRASLFSRVLSRRPQATRSRRTSTFRTPSSLRKPTSTEASDTSSDRSPSKTRPPLFASRGIENTRRAFTKIKAFPAPAGRPGDSLRPSVPNSVTASPVNSIRGMPPPPSTPAASTSRATARAVSMRDNQTLSPDDATATRRTSMIAALTPGGKRPTNRSGDIQSLFGRQKARRQRPSDRSGAASRSSIESATTVEENTSGTVSPVPPVSSAPRIELNPTPPIAWGKVLGNRE